VIDMFCVMVAHDPATGRLLAAGNVHTTKGHDTNSQVVEVAVS